MTICRRPGKLIVRSCGLESLGAQQRVDEIHQHQHGGDAAQHEFERHQIAPMPRSQARVYHSANAKNTTLSATYRRSDIVAQLLRVLARKAYRERTDAKGNSRVEAE